MYLLAIDIFSQMSQLTLRVQLLEQTIMALKRNESLSPPHIIDEIEEQSEDNVINVTNQSMFTKPRSNSIVTSERVIVFINTKSGGQLGKALVTKFENYVGSDYVFVLDEKGPVPALENFKNEPNLKVITCGGDGTVKWILESIDKVQFSGNVAVGVLPLGTGNDIARVFNWGGGFASNDSVSKFLSQVTHSQGVKLDRWSVKIEETLPDNTKITKTLNMSNYLSFGVDAKIALNFHNRRNEQPNLFTSQAVNKFWYFGYGVTNFVESAMESKNMIHIVAIEVDGRKLQLSDTYEGVVILNLPSYAAGCDLWGTARDDNFQLQSINDGMVEVCGIRNTSHLASIQHGSNAVRLAQGSVIKLTYKPKNQKGVAFQIDGEPWNQVNECEITIAFYNQANMLARYRVK
jgi:diacylglycerol kinase (ATP)